jgi:hypothetical protein
MRSKRSLVALFGLVLTACGGSSGPPAQSPPPPVSGTPPPISQTPPSPPPSPSPPPPPTDAQRIAAATATAQNHALCNAVRPFYWEIGDGTAKRASDAVGPGAPGALDPMAIASASQWVYATYVAELRAGALTPADIQFLTLRSGYVNMAALSCSSSATVDTCLQLGTNGVQDPATIGKFFYNGGHLQRHAHDIGLGGFNASGLTAEVQGRIGNFGFVYASPELPGGITSSADGYAQFLRSILRGELKMSTKLGTSAVCTNPATCADALFTPIPATESWHYSIGHWVEDDPVAGDGAFSSAGAFGFYPWIDGTKTWYGVLARVLPGQDEGFASAQCGRVIRKAWVTGVSQ